MGRCTALAVYRHQYLITKAYGNLVGLSRLMHFLCEQTGAECGELVVHATLADAEPGHSAEAKRSHPVHRGTAVSGRRRAGDVEPSAASRVSGRRLGSVGRWS